MPTLDVLKPSEPLGVAYTLGELERAVARAINRYGSETKILGHNQIMGVTLEAHFPKGSRPHVTFTPNETSYSDEAPENLA